MELKEAIEKILTGNCILFTGSGFSCDAKNISGNSPRIGGKLTEFLYSECGIDENDYNLKSASETYSENKGEFQLIDFLRNEYTISEVSTPRCRAINVIKLVWFTLNTQTKRKVDKEIIPSAAARLHRVASKLASKLAIKTIK